MYPLLPVPVFRKLRTDHLPACRHAACRRRHFDHQDERSTDDVRVRVFQPSLGPYVKSVVGRTHLGRFLRRRRRAASRRRRRARHRLRHWWKYTHPVGVLRDLRAQAGPWADYVRGYRRCVLRADRACALLMCISLGADANPSFQVVHTVAGPLGRSVADLERMARVKNCDLDTI